MEMGSHMVSAPRVPSISGDNSAGGTWVAENTHATSIPFLRKTGGYDIFLTTIDTLLLLILSLVYVCKTCNPRDKGRAPLGRDFPAFKGITITWALSPRSGLVLHSSICVLNGPSLTFSFIKTGSSISGPDEDSGVVHPPIPWGHPQQCPGPYLLCLTCSIIERLSPPPTEWTI